MGCGGSKKGKNVKIELVMQKTGNADIDALFDDLTGPLTDLAEVAECLRKGL